MHCLGRYNYTIGWSGGARAAGRDGAPRVAVALFRDDGDDDDDGGGGGRFGAATSAAVRGGVRAVFCVCFRPSQ